MGTCGRGCPRRRSLGPLRRDRRGLLLLAPETLASLFGVPSGEPSDLLRSQRALSDRRRSRHYSCRGGSRAASYKVDHGRLSQGRGALAFVLDYVPRGAPASFLVFAVSDGLLAALTLWARRSRTCRAPHNTGSDGRARVRLLDRQRRRLKKSSGMPSAMTMRRAAAGPHGVPARIGTSRSAQSAFTTMASVKIAGAMGYPHARTDERHRARAGAA